MQWQIIFFFYKNVDVGKSFVEKDTNKIIKKIYDKAQENNCEIIIPNDCLVSTSFEGSAKKKIRTN